jgi:hypothetical protein
MAEPKDALSREIDDELRRERLLKLWDKYGTYILAAALAVVVGVGGVKYVDNRRQQDNQAASVRYIVALRDFAISKSADAQKSLEELVAAAPAGYATLSRLRLAAYDQSAGNTTEAVSAYEDIAKDGSIDPILGDYARLQVAMLKLDTASFTDLKNRLTPLSADRNPWRYSARELLGMAAYKSGRAAEARNHFQRLLTDRTAPPGITERARIMLSVLAEGDPSKVPAAEKSESPAKSEPAKDDKSKSKAADKKIN